MISPPNSSSRNIYFFYNSMDTVIVKEIPVMSANDMIGSLGGSLGLFLGFSFCGTLLVSLDWILKMVAKLKKSKQSVIDE